MKGKGKFILYGVLAGLILHIAKKQGIVKGV